MAAPTLEARAHSGPSYTTLLDSTNKPYNLHPLAVPPRVEALQRIPTGCDPASAVARIGSTPGQPLDWEPRAT